MDLIPIEVEADYEYKSKHAALFQFLDFDGYYVLGMKMVESLLAPGTLKCQFLLEWNIDNDNPTMDGIIARCGIYSCRPMLCAAFPTKFSENELGAVMVNVSAFEQEISHPVYKTCPLCPTEKDIADADEITRVLVLKKYETEYFKNLAIEWNENPQKISDFWGFLEKSYKNRVVIE